MHINISSFVPDLGLRWIRLVGAVFTPFSFPNSILTKNIEWDIFQLLTFFFFVNSMQIYAKKAVSDLIKISVSFSYFKLNSTEIIHLKAENHSYKRKRSNIADIIDHTKEKIRNSKRNDDKLFIKIKNENKKWMTLFTEIYNIETEFMFVYDKRFIWNAHIQN